MPKTYANNRDKLAYIALDSMPQARVRWIIQLYAGKPGNKCPVFGLGHARIDLDTPSDVWRVADKGSSAEACKLAAKLNRLRHIALGHSKEDRA